MSNIFKTNSSDKVEPDSTYIKTIESKLKQLESGFGLMMLCLFAVIVIGTINLGYLYFNTNTNANANSNQTTLPVVNYQNNVAHPYKSDITSFYENTAISEVGYQLDLKKQSISTHNTSNCSTPEVPPLTNGCGFVVRIYAAAIPQTQSLLLNLEFEATMNPDDKIALDIKDTEQGIVTTTLGVISGRDSKLSLPLPGQMKPSEQILVRLWPQQNSNISIKGIAVEHFEYQKLQPVKLKFAPNVLSNFTGKKGLIYLDTAKNGKYDRNSSILWNCSQNFPGAAPIIFDSSTEYQISRDDSCIQSNYPPEWKKDNFENALPSYNYLVVVDPDLPSEQYFSLEIVPDQFEYEVQ